MCLNAGGMGRRDAESETLIVASGGGFDGDIANTLLAKANDSHEADLDTYVTHALRGEGFDASEDGRTGRGTPLVPVYAIQERAVAENPASGPQGAGVAEDIAYTLEARNKVQATAYRTTGNDGAYATGEQIGALGTGTDPSSHVIAFSSKDHGADAGDISPTLRAGGHAASHANAGVPPAVAFALRGREGGAQAEVQGEQTGALRAANGGSTRDYVSAGYAVRRMTPRECERLQGFPDDYTAVPGKNGKVPDGPRYKALGNSMAVPVMRWIGERIAAQAEGGMA